jgi:hypothetical protein
MIAVPMVYVIAWYIAGRRMERRPAITADVLSSIATSAHWKDVRYRFLRELSKLLFAAFTLAGTLALFLVL